MNERRIFLFGERAMRIMAGCVAACQEFDLPLCPAAIFFSALNEIDDASDVLRSDVRNQALALAAERLRASDVDFKLELAKMTQLLERQVNAGDIAFVTPLALLKACAAFDSGALDPAFRAIGLSLDNLLRRIEEELQAPNSQTVFQGPFRRYCLRSGPLLSKVPALETCVTVMPPWPRPNMQQNYSNVALRVLHQPAAALSPPSSTLDRPSLGKQKESTSRNYKQ